METIRAHRPRDAELSVHYSQLNAAEIGKLVEKLAACTGLVTLSLWCDAVTDEGARLVADALPPTVRDLRLGSNLIGPLGAGGVLGAAAAATLVSLNLWDNALKNGGAKLVAAALPRCASLVSLNVGKNFIGDKGVAALADGAAACPTLQTLVVDDNKFGRRGAASLARALGTLRVLDIRKNRRVKGAGRQALADAALRSLSIETLYGCVYVYESVRRSIGLRPARLALLAFAGGPPGRTPRDRFLGCDGDLAAMRRVAAMLLP